jgi:DNA-binding phage protein
MEEGDLMLFLLALRYMAEAQGGMSAVSKKAKLKREVIDLTLAARDQIKEMIDACYYQGTT